MREIRQSGSEGGGPQINAVSLPLSIEKPLRGKCETRQFRLLTTGYWLLTTGY